ncbi:glycoside hydrolase family 32 protein [Halalkalibacter sp. AB-rgal2]|uniref:glycoside hydrolase family 32 protein n=1 Tax=Halalkalibacter sp. AB-rgal2 TaxID=3242695 RepID=UPI00359DAE12
MSDLNSLVEARIDYREKYRPQFHFSPRKHWMNDPNGLVFYKGEYHLFYQYYPGGNTWGPMHWGHAKSNDMVKWQHCSIALEPDELGMIFSGSVVVDWHDTSGFFNGGEGLVAIFTHSNEGVQTQSIAYSLDEGQSWTKYENNPVIPNEHIKDFRDPKVFWHEVTQKWIMVLAAGQKVMLYGSTNLRKWTFLSEFGESEGAHGGVWECPDLFSLPVNGDLLNQKWILQVDIGSGAVAGGSGAQYFVGEFDGTTFKNVNEPEKTLWLDFGKDFYATQSFSDIPIEDGRRIWLAWMSNWEYANEVPTSPWRSAMTIPREVELKQTANGDIKLHQHPIHELKKLRQEKFKMNNRVVNGEMNVLKDQKEEVFELIAEVENLSAEEFGFELRKSSKKKEGTIVGYNLLANKLFIDRENSGDVSFSEQFKGKHVATIEKSLNKVKFHIFIDKSSIELFFQEGEVVLTDLIFPDDDSQELAFYIKGGEVTILNLEVYALKSVWGDESEGAGNVNE